MMPVFHLLLAGGMLFTGSINTITTKAADLTSAINRYGDSVPFNHPFFQAAGMFVGELLCLFAFYILRCRARATGTKFDEAKPFSPFLFVIPAICDMSATSFMYLGLSLTDASIFQMLRGSVVIFTSLLRVFVLKKRLGIHEWIGIVLVMGGTAIVGSQSQVCPADGSACSSSSGASSATIGNILIILAQMIVSIQMVVEEKFIGGYDIPALQVVGFEGMFGLSILSTVLVGMYFIPLPDFLCNSYCLPGPVVNGTSVNTADPFAMQAWSSLGGQANWEGRDLISYTDTSAFAVTAANASATCACQYPTLCNRFEDSYDAFVMLGNSYAITLFTVGNVLSIAFFNYFGVSVTKHINSATRMVLDSLRTLVIWAVSLALAWESFCWIEVIGFVVLIAGTVIYNGLIRIPGIKYEDAAAAIKPAEEGGAGQALLDDDSGVASGDSLLGGGSLNAGTSKEGSVQGIALGGLAPFQSTPTFGRAAMLKGR